MKKSIRKLTLTRDTVQKLDSEQLSEVAGGYSAHPLVTCVVTCPSVCTLQTTA